MDNLQDKTIGVVGFGKFGKIVCQYLFPKNPVVIFSPNIQNEIVPNNCKKCNSVEEVIKSADIIIPAVPIRTFGTVCKQIAQIVTPEKIIMDVCSVKEYPVSIMEETFLQNRILATHLCQLKIP